MPAGDPGTPSPSSPPNLFMVLEFQLMEDPGTVFCSRPPHSFSGGSQLDGCLLPPSLPPHGPPTTTVVSPGLSLRQALCRLQSLTQPTQQQQVGNRKETYAGQNFKNLAFIFSWVQCSALLVITVSCLAMSLDRYLNLLGLLSLASSTAPQDFQSYLITKQCKHNLCILYISE